MLTCSHIYSYADRIFEKHPLLQLIACAEKFFSCLRTLCISYIISYFQFFIAKNGTLSLNCHQTAGTATCNEKYKEYCSRHTLKFLNQEPKGTEMIRDFLSGGHVNPAVTAALFILGKISFVHSLLYVVAQMFGAAFGAGLSYIVYYG